MKHLLSIVFATFIGMTAGIDVAEAAKRMGGGKNVGTQRESIKQQQPAPQQPAQAAPAPAKGAPAAAPAASGASRWLGPVAGLLAGGLLGAMLFGGAFDGIKFMDVLMILLLAGGIFFVWRMLRKPQQPARPAPMEYAGAGPMGSQPAPAMPSQGSVAQAAQPQASSAYFPAGFDAEAFVRNSKLNFMRLQEANDRGDLSTLRDVVTPELFAEIEAQLRDRGGVPQKTDVVTLDAQVVEVVTEKDHYVASVRFSGMIREDAAAQPEHFSEVWHLTKPTSGRAGWLVAGIQQD